MATGQKYYYDEIVRQLVLFSVFWAVVAMAVGVYISAELIWPTIDFGQPWLSFGRLRPLHTNGIIFGFGVSALFQGLPDHARLNGFPKPHFVSQHEPATRA